MASVTEVGCFFISVKISNTKSEHKNQSPSLKFASHGQENGEGIWGQRGGSPSHFTERYE